MQALRTRHCVLFWLAAAIIVLGCPAACQDSGTLIDNPLPRFDDPPSPWASLADQPILTFAFKTSWDGIGWTEEQKNSVRDAFACLDFCLPNQIFEESGDFTLRWAGQEFFKDWRGTFEGYDHPGWNMGGEKFTDTNGNGRWDAGEGFVDDNGDGKYNGPPLAVAYKHGNGPWDQDQFPNNEIYFNSAYDWHFGLAAPPADKYDFWTVAMHESIHMLACDSHAIHDNEVMYPYIGKGERKLPKWSDLEILTGSGFVTGPPPNQWPNPIPEPSSACLFALGSGIVGLLRMSRRRYLS